MKGSGETEEGGHLGEVTAQGQQGMQCVYRSPVCLPLSPILHVQPEV